LAGGKRWAPRDEWQALYHVEDARRALKAARQEAEEQRRLVLMWNEQQARRLEEGKKLAAEAAAAETPQTVWCAWAWANGKTQIAIGRELGFPDSVKVNQECRRYVLAHFPERLYRSRWRVEHHGDRHTLLKRALKDKPEPPKPERWRAAPLPLPATDSLPVLAPAAGSRAVVYRQTVLARQRWVLEQRRAGRTLQQIADEMGLSRERIRQMQSRAAEREAKFSRTCWLWYQIRDTRGLGRPLDIDANRQDYRGKWLPDEC
jgi:hypothetical protein